MANLSSKYLIIGGGIAAAGCVKQLREEGTDGSITLVTSEPRAPYHRPPLSKGFMRGEEGMSEVMFEASSWYEENQVAVLTGVPVIELDASNHVATLGDGRTINYEKALLAAGSSVRRLTTPGNDLKGIHYLRTLADCEAIKEAAKDAKRVAFVGGSFIATEVAASLTALGLHCELVMMEEVPLERFFGVEVGKYFGDILTKNGVVLHTSQNVARFEGNNGRVSRVIAESGLVVDCDFVVIGAGVTPNIDLATRAGLKTNKGVLTNKYLESSAEDIFVAGDIAEYESPIHQQVMRIEHWDVAINHGIVAARNMLGQMQPYDIVPYFWSDLADWSSMETVGPAMDWDEIWWRGSPADKEFTAWYVRGHMLVGALAVGRSEDIDTARQLMTNRTDLSDKRSTLEDKNVSIGSQAE